MNQNETTTTPVEPPQNWYFTFGFGHAYPNGYVKLYGTAASTREEMFKLYGPKWAFQYPEHKFLRQIDKYNLYEVSVALN